MISHSLTPHTGVNCRTTNSKTVCYTWPTQTKCGLCNLMFIGPCIIAIVDEWKTNLMSLAIFFFHLLCAQQVSDINISIFRSLRLCWWITTSVVLFSDRCVLEFLLRLVFGGVRFAGWSRLQLLRQRNKYINLNILTYCSELVFIQKRTWFCKMQVKLKAVFSRTQFLPLILRFPYFRWMGRWIFLHAYPSVR